MAIRLLFCLLLLWTAAPAAAQGADTYRLAVGDEILVTVYGEEDLSGQHKIASNGLVTLPLVGEIEAVGESLEGLGSRIADRYRGRFLVNPRVAVSVSTYRPIYVMGEVKKPGSFPYNAGMTLVNAVALAGGYTYRANENKVIVIRNDGSEFVAAPDTAILPGDTVRVNHRFF